MEKRRSVKVEVFLYRINGHAYLQVDDPLYASIPKYISHFLGYPLRLNHLNALGQVEHLMMVYNLFWDQGWIAVQIKMPKRRFFL